jgi:hypothetical protein
MATTNTGTSNIEYQKRPSPNWAGLIGSEEEEEEYPTPPPEKKRIRLFEY